MNSRTNENRRSIRMLVATFILFFALIIIAILMLRGCEPANDMETPMTRSLPSLQFQDDVGYVPPAGIKTANLAVTSGFTFTAGTTTQRVSFSNSDTNQCRLTVSLYLADGTLLYKSGMISPGNSIDSIELSTALKEGTYKNALMVYEIYTINGNPQVLSMCEFPIEITCIA